MGILDAVLDVLLGVATWFGDAFDAIVPMFWTAGEAGAAGSLTFMGVLAVAGLAFSVVFLLLRVISNFLQFRA